jgi:hypothetical protein
MTRTTPLLARNEQFASTYTPVALGPPTAEVLVVTCEDTESTLRSSSGWSSETL